MQEAIDLSVMVHRASTRRGDASGEHGRKTHLKLSQKSGMGDRSTVTPHPDPLPQGEGTLERLQKAPSPSGRGMGVRATKEARGLESCHDLSVLLNFEMVSISPHHATPS
jgi:hypothetical protein